MSNIGWLLAGTVSTLSLIVAAMIGATFFGDVGAVAAVLLIGVCIVGGTVLASVRGSPAAHGAFWCALLGPIGLAVVIAASGRRCPMCLSLIHPGAFRCPRCQADLLKLPVTR